MIDTHFASRSLTFVSHHLKGAQRSGLDLDSMPPHFTLISFEETQGILEEPILLDDVPVVFWGDVVHQNLSMNPQYEGFILWLIAEVEGEDKIALISFKRGDAFPYMMFLDMDLELESLTPTDIRENLPTLGDMDFNAPYYNH
jgi:hypothetical protein